MTLWLRFFDWPLRVKMAALLVLATVLPLAVAALVDIREARQRLLASTSALLEARGDQLVRELDSFHHNYQRAADRVAHLPDVVRRQAKGDPADPLNPSLRALLDVWPASDPNIRGLAILDRSGVVQVATEPVLVGKDLSFQAHIRNALEGHAVISDIHIAQEGVLSLPTIAYLAPVHGSDPKLLGLVAIWVRATALWDVMKSSNALAGPGSFAVLFDHEGIRIAHTYSDEIVFHPGGPLTAATVDALSAERRFGAKTREFLEQVRAFPEQFDRARAASPDPGVFRGFAPVNQSWNYGVGRRFQSVPWTVFYMVPELALNAQMAKMTRDKVLFAGVIVLLALLVGALFATVILRAIRELSLVNEALANGDLDARVAVPRGDEIGLLGASFNAMADRIRTQAQALFSANEGLELRVRERTGELVQTTRKLELEIVERTRSEEALRASEERFQALEQNSWDAVHLLTAEGVILYESPSVLHVLGYRPEELVGRNSFELVHSDDVARVGELFAPLTATPGLTLTAEVRIRHKDGSWPWMDCVATNLLEHPAVRAIAVNYRDITGRRRTEQALRESEGHFRFLNDLGEATRTLADPEQIMAVMARMLGEHLHASRCAYADVEEGGEQFAIRHDYTDGCASTVGNYQLSLFGARAVATLHRGQTLIIRNVAAELLPGDGADMFNAIGIQAIITCPLVKEGDIRAMMAVHQTTPREWKSGEISIVEEVVERCWATIERWSAEEKIRQLNLELEQRVGERTAQLEAANKELEAFSYSVSHDLRAPLRTLDGFSQAVLEDYGPQLPKEGQRYLQTIREGAQRMGDLVDDLLAFARLSRQSLKKRTVDTDNLVRATLAELQASQQERGLEIRIGDLPPCEGDRALLKQVWYNLLANALKYTQNCQAAIVEIGCQRSNGANIYFVRDNGAGFDMQYAHKLFGVFQRLHRAEDYEGTGIGLAIVQRVIHRHGGRVWAEAAVGRGATFYFTLEGQTES